MATAQSERSFNPLRSTLKALGGFADLTTRRGRALKKWEDVMTSGFNRLAGNDAYLRYVGKAMERSFILQAQANRAVERTLKAARVPSAAELHEVHYVTTGLDEKLDALGCQLEVMMDRLESIESRLQALEAGGARGRSRARASGGAA